MAYNFDNTTTPTIHRTDSTYQTVGNIAGTVAPITAGMKDFVGIDHANKLLFRPRSGSFFKGHLSHVSLRDSTNYFTVTDPGSWLFDGFDLTTENYIR